jgi:hypothetical protein
MIVLPLSWLEWLTEKGLWRRPKFLIRDVDEEPDDLDESIIYREVRGGHPKWAHFICPKCSETISVPIVGREAWSLRVDFFRRPTLYPSIWQTGSCGAHFFVTKGELAWCQEARRIRTNVWA